MKKLLSSLLVFSLSVFSIVGCVQAADNSVPIAEAAYSLPININTADAQLLASALNGIGNKKAEAIIHYRETVGDFQALEELTEIKGIGVALIERNRDRMVLK